MESTLPCAQEATSGTAVQSSSGMNLCPLDLFVPVSERHASGSLLGAPAVSGLNQMIFEWQ